MSCDFIPVLLGADLNCYNLARAFNEKYGVKSKVFGKYSLGATANSRAVEFTSVPDLSEASVMLETVRRVAEANPDKRIFLLGCTDEYAEMIIENKAELSRFCFCPCTTPELARSLSDKESFYTMCEEYSLPFPQTYIIKPDAESISLKPSVLGFDYPIIIKPSNSIQYWKHPFEGMKKVYVAETSREADEIISKIRASKYPCSIIVQNRIPGTDSRMFVLTCYSGNDGKVNMSCLGHVLLEEHTPKGLGNHAAIITEEHSEIVDTIKEFLEKIHYTGFSNFDIKLDPRDEKFKIFECNLRQGRSNYYITNAGVSIPDLLDGDDRGTLKGCQTVTDSAFWTCIPKSVVYKYTSDKTLVALAKKLVRTGKFASSYFYAPDLKHNIKRIFYVFANHFNQYKKYRKYLKTRRGFFGLGKKHKKPLV